MHYAILFFTILFFAGCSSGPFQAKISKEKRINTIDSLLTDWHKNAADAEIDNYFSLMDSSFHFLGTDASEDWDKAAFRTFCEPYFSTRTTWNFTALKRNIYINRNKRYAWFDELLQTQMGLCRGAGMLERKKDKWKLKHYVLSMTIPNEDNKTVTELKKEKEDLFLQKKK